MRKLIVFIVSFKKKVENSKTAREKNQQRGVASAWQVCTKKHAQSKPTSSTASSSPRAPQGCFVCLFVVFRYQWNVTTFKLFWYLLDFCICMIWILLYIFFCSFIKSKSQKFLLYHLQFLKNCRFTMQFLLNRIILHLSTMSVKADLSINRLGDKGRGNLNQIGCETEKDVSSTQGKVRKHRMRPSD